MARAPKPEGLFPKRPTSFSGKHAGGRWTDRTPIGVVPICVLQMIRNHFNSIRCHGFSKSCIPQRVDVATTTERQLRRIERPHIAYHPMVYICSPYAGNIEENSKNARRYIRFAVEKGYLPITPHLLYPQFHDYGLQRERAPGKFFGIALMSKCSEVWVFGERIGNGMKTEVEQAKNRGIT